ncbi:family 10 glycosylhydrolase [Geobacter pickeringii]|uniref:LamG-like jellyroll fold domain-containing protein n=1 Tax=Geobacter pickeringii TaxID=345632 RepID=A0A0B5B9J5_9BACT|nr:family 10 glycosylhydrolase [Geobacter pickeringii]AJE03247.1 hypothetical protein GPICK_07680 [Geobacter pickeringii]
MKRSTFIWFIAAMAFHLILPFGSGWAGGVSNVAADKAVSVVSFDGNWPKSSDGIPVVRRGGKIVATGVVGKALSLGQGEVLELDAGRLINPREGSISLWVRPHWSGSDKASHTFVSFSWEPGGSYFVLSRGWWEPAGARLTYLVANNNEYANLARDIRYEKGEWTHLVAAWEEGNPGRIRLYVNGLLSSENKRYVGTVKPGRRRLYIGSDEGTPHANRRWADADFDEISLYRRALSETEVRDLYERQKPVRTPVPKHADGVAVEMRAIFDEGIGWQSESGARETIRRIKKAGFNVYLPCVWHGNGARYPTTFTESERKQRFYGRDPLARLIAIAHENGIKVYPWFTVALREKDFSLRHPEFFDNKTPDNAFDLHRPDFQRFITGMITDVVRRYPVDGINLDYIRTMGTCRCKFCADEYRKTHGRELLGDLAHPKADGTLEPHLQSWQDGAVESIVREVSTQARKLRPNIVISISGQPQPYPNQEGRQEARWLNAGLADLVFDMEYANPPDAERHHLVSSQFRDPRKLVLLISNHDWATGRPVPKQPDKLAHTVDYVRERWGRGVGIYLYSMLDDEQMAAFARGPFSRPSRVPDYATRAEE